MPTQKRNFDLYADENVIEDAKDLAKRRGDSASKVIEFGTFNLLQLDTMFTQAMEDAKKAVDHKKPEELTDEDVPKALQEALPKLIESFTGYVQTTIYYLMGSQGGISKGEKEALSKVSESFRETATVGLLAALEASQQHMDERMTKYPFTHDRGEEGRSAQASPEE